MYRAAAVCISDNRVELKVGYNATAGSGAAVHRCLCCLGRVRAIIIITLHVCKHVITKINKSFHCGFPLELAFISTIHQA